MANKKKMLLAVSKNQVKERIKFENPWWVNGRIEKDYDRLKRRLYFNIFKPLAHDKEIRRGVVLMGPRRVGKTVILHHLIQDFIDSGVDPRKIIFITIENPIYNNLGLEDLFNLAKEAVGLTAKSGWYVIFDEIQYCNNWEIYLKSLVDSYRGDKFIVSGSAAAALKIKSIESGAGRFTDFLLPPLTFNEYLSLCGLERIIVPAKIPWEKEALTFFTSGNMEKLNDYFLDYLNFGGYPEVIFSDKIKSDPGRYIRQDIIDKVLLRDLPSLYGINDVQELNSLFTTIAFNTGGEFSFEALANQSGLPKNTIKKYIEYLEAAFLIKRIRRVGEKGKKFQRENFFKIYLTNPSLRSALFSPVKMNDELIGNIIETTIYAQWTHRDWVTPWYARWKTGEVDMVVLGKNNNRPAWALEIKSSNRYIIKPSELKSLLSFCKENGLKKAIVTTYDRQEIKTYNDVTLYFLPFASYAYTVGRNTLEHKNYDFLNPGDNLIAPKKNN